MFKAVVFFCGLFYLACFPTFLNATPDSPVSQSDITGWYQFTFENDAMSAINKSDDGYSNGIAFNWGHSDYTDFDSIEMPNWIRYISDWTFINQGLSKKYSIAYTVSQSMYTPDDMKQSELIENDRPYAGTLLWHSKIRSYADNRANSLGLILGVVGPASLAEQSQTIIHELIDATIPQGWGNQINNEFVFRVEAEHIKRFYRFQFSENVIFDTSSYSEAGAGNLRSDIGTGLTFRLGSMLDQTYESINPNTSGSMSGATVDSKGKFYWLLFSSAYASYVINDITLDGNTFSDSHSVELINEQLMISAGIAALYNNWGFVFSVQRGNDQFEGQTSISKYGSLTISYHY